MGQRPIVMWSAVCSAPLSQLSLVDSPSATYLLQIYNDQDISQLSVRKLITGRHCPVPLLLNNFCVESAWSALAPLRRANQSDSRVIEQYMLDLLATYR